MKPTSILPPGLKPPQFSLRTLLLLVTLCAIVSALVNVLPPMAIAGLVFLLISIFAHVAGNAIGTRLRDLGGRREQRFSAGNESAASGQGGRPRCAPPTQLSQRQSLGWPVLVVTGAGCLAGGAGGGAWTAFSLPHVAALAIVIGVVAFAALGGFAAFLAFSFAQVGLGALRQAQALASSESAGGPPPSPDRPDRCRPAAKA